jgi:alkanesulfonate monooxygenase SsuD/methylene tetrahydromethanopterin reductase-like flavin-dependent oxidoreductase (luciferase family)
MIEIAQTAERGLLDMVFCADTHSVFTGPRAGSAQAALCRLDRTVHDARGARQPHQEYRPRLHRLDQLRATLHGGAQVCLARSGERRTLRLEHGHVRQCHRGAQLQQRAAQPKDERYRRGKEFVEVVQALWDSWDDDAFIRDRDACLFFDPEKMHTLNHHGEFFDVRGPLNVPRSPQGQPVLVQAGASDDGRELAAQTAEVVFTAHSASNARKHSMPISRAGWRATDAIPITSRSCPACRSRSAELTPKQLRSRSELDELLHPDVGVSLLSTRMGHDLTGFPLDGPLPELPQNKVIGSRSDDAIAMARSKNMTIRQLYQWFARQRGHAGFVGTPTEVADQMEQWFNEGACDGFNFLAPVFRSGSTTSSIWSCRNCSAAGSIARPTKARRCATSSACRSAKPPCPRFCHAGQGDGPRVIGRSGSIRQTPCSLLKHWLVPASEVRDTSRHPRTRTSEAKGTSKLIGASAAFDLKFLVEFAATAVGTSNRRH